MSLTNIPALKYIGMVFNLLQGPLIFCVSMCRTRVAFLFKKYFCQDWCCFGCFKNEEFINEECEELAVIDMLKARIDEPDGDASSTPQFLQPFIQGTHALLPNFGNGIVKMGTLWGKLKNSHDQNQSTCKKML